MGKYTLIYADPPWSYRDKANDGERGMISEHLRSESDGESA